LHKHYVQANKQSNAQISLLNFSANIGTLFGRGTSTRYESIRHRMFRYYSAVPRT
jgi:hypothetical protein